MNRASGKGKEEHWLELRWERTNHELFCRYCIMNLFIFDRIVL
jgi:hypothetical protein